MKRRKRRLIMAGIIVGAIAVVFVLTITIAGGAFMPRRYLEPWSKTYHQRFDDPRMQVVAHGLLAANSHNMQPWRIELDETDPASFLLYADGERLTPQVDPPARQLTISQGTFLESCAVAANELGYACDIELFPEGEYDAAGTPVTMVEKPVARVRLRQVTATTDPLYDCLFLPDTVRVAYEDAPLTEAETAGLTGASSDPAVQVVLLDGTEDLQELGRLAIEAATVEGSIARISKETAELIRGTEYQKNKYRYGFSLEGQGTSGVGLWFTEGLLGLIPSLGGGGDTNDRFIKQTIAQVEHTPVYILILTADNSRTSQVKAGMAYSRVQLTAQSMGLAVQPLSQILEEYPEMEALRDEVHRKYASDGQTIQMLVRVGRPTKEVPRSIRRGAMELVIE